MAISDSLKAATVAALLAASGTVAVSQEQTATDTAQRVVIERFDGSDPSLVLGGQIDLHADSSPWLVHLSGGALVMENRTNPQSVHYNDITWVKYPDESVISSTEGSVIAVEIEARNTGRGGAGLIVGSGKGGTYLMFAVDGEGGYHVLKKDGRHVRPVHSAKHPAVRTDGFNALSFVIRGDRAVFFANGAEIIQVPYTRAAKMPGRAQTRSGIGLAAFGIGSYSFDNVEISEGG